MVKLMNMYGILILNEMDVINKFKENSSEIPDGDERKVIITRLGMHELMNRSGGMSLFIKSNWPMSGYDFVFYDRGDGTLIVVKDNSSKFSVAVSDIQK